MIALQANTTQHILKRIIVGSVLTVDVHINPKLVIAATIYNHHHCTPNNKPGTMIAILFIKHTNSTTLGVVQYALVLSCFNTFTDGWVSNWPNIF